MIKKNDEVHVNLIGVVVDTIDCRGEKVAIVKGRTLNNTTFYCFNIPTDALCKLEDE